MLIAVICWSPIKASYGEREGAIIHAWRSWKTIAHVRNGFSLRFVVIAVARGAMNLSIEYAAWIESNPRIAKSRTSGSRSAEFGFFAAILLPQSSPGGVFDGDNITTSDMAKQAKNHRW
jgi:hypothetical protein